MAAVYILFSSSAGKYYVGSTKELDVRIVYHQEKEFAGSFTAKYMDWELFYSIENISNSTARKIEAHIKKMKSRVYLENLRKYPELSEKLIRKYSN